MCTDSTPERGMVPHPPVNLACAHATRRVRRQETGEKSRPGHAYRVTSARGSECMSLR